jgi:carboxypeptidase Taq
LSVAATTASPLERLKRVLGEVADLKHAEAVLDWDARVSMPPAGAEARADAAATLARLSHERFVADGVGELLGALNGFDSDPDSDQAALVRVTRRLWERTRRVPSELAGEMARANGVAVAAWDQAKAASDFASFAPHLEHQLELKQRYIECFPEVESAYDVLLEDYEEGMTATEVASVFDRLKDELITIVERRGGDTVDLPHGPFPVASQKEAGRRVLEAFGAEDSTWRIDETPHPFASKPGVGDIRLTTHTEENDLTSLFSTMHEFGHGVYEYDVDPSYARTPLGGGTSSAVHESQSRTWENLVGRSPGFWRWFYPQLRALIPERLGDIDEAAFVRGITEVRPGLIRGDADEVTYGLHIILRFELEQELLAGSVSVRDLPGVWRERMLEYLGIEVPDDAHGVLQDMHWAVGLFGYFPTYQLGNVISVQIWERAVADLGDLQGRFARGEFSLLRAWLREHVYRHGSKYPPRELLRRVTGSELDPEPYVRYLHAKFA